MSRIRPRCRVCNAPVEFMGDLCADDADYESDGTTEIERADRHTMEQRQAEEDY